MKISVIAAFFASLCLVVLQAQPAQAQATRTWVSGVGDDANPCSRTAPCKTFAGAISKTAAGGEINVVDPGGFGTVTINKSITISSQFEAGVLAPAGATAIIINAGPGDRVVLEGLDIEGVGTGLSGIKFNSGLFLEVRRSTFHHFNASGIDLAPTNTAQVFINNCVATDNAGSGILVHPQGSASLFVAINNSTLNGNGSGLLADGTASSGTLRVTFKDSTAAANSVAAISATGGTGLTRILTDHSAAVNSVTGLLATNATAQILATYTTVTGNQTGLSAVSGGVLTSYSTNQVNANNIADGVFSGTVLQQ